MALSWARWVAYGAGMDVSWSVGDNLARRRHSGKGLERRGPVAHERH
jgi:hypothetical protein